MTTVRVNHKVSSEPNKKTNQCMQMATQIASSVPFIPSSHTQNHSLLLPLIKHQLNHHLTPFNLRVLQAHLNRPMMARSARQPIIKTLDVSPRNDLSQAAILRVPDLDEIGVEQQHVGAEHGGALSLADKLHDDRAADVAVLVDVHGALFVAEQELLVREAEHAQGILVG